ncbi:MAG: hypothetical protein H7Z20_00620 [Bdellovibrio sp.]|nr:hypothetical protein [Methylotenera sp.]
MPLKKGTSQAVVSSNIKTLVHKWGKEGSIGSSHFATKQKAIKQAVAISMKKPGKAATPSLAATKSDFRILDLLSSIALALVVRLVILPTGAFAYNVCVDLQQRRLRSHVGR